MKTKEGGGMENPEKIEIEGLKTIHKLCKFGADHNMEGCTFTEIVECMFDELAKAQAVPAQLDVNSILHDIDCYFDNGLSNTERTANNLLQSIYEKLSGEVKTQDTAND